MAEGGHIELATDSHRTTTFSPDLIEEYGSIWLDDVQLVDVAVYGEGDGCQSEKSSLAVWCIAINAVKHRSAVRHCRRGSRASGPCRPSCLKPGP